MNIIEARDDPQLFGRMVTDRATWRAWDTVLRGAFALPMDATDKRLFATLADREPPTEPVRELWVVAGRRSGKTATAAEVAVWRAAFHDHRPNLKPGERAVVLVLAVDRAQAKVLLGYVRAYFREVPMLAAMVTRETQDGLELSNGAAIEVATNSFRRVRGRTTSCAIFDECSFWRDETSSEPDRETYNAVLPSMATVPDALLIGISSPYRRAGLLWQKFTDHYGKAGDVLVIRATSRQLNPTLPQKIVDRALADDNAAARSEWLAEFRTDIEGYVSRDVLTDAVEPGRRELAPVAGTSYRGFVDPSGGSRDAFTLAIAHRDGENVVLDCVRERRPPFSPDQVCKEYAETLRSYSLGTVSGDRYAAEWPVERFRSHGIYYLPAAKPKSDLYRDLLPHLNAGRVELLDNDRLVNQLAGLERRTARGGRDSIDHAPAAHDDLANVLAGVVSLASKPLEQRRMRHFRS